MGTKTLVLPACITSVRRIGFGKKGLTNLFLTGGQNDFRFWLDDDLLHSHRRHSFLEVKGRIMDNQICQLHNAPMVAKDGQFGTWHSHIIKDVGFCNGKKITPFKDKPAQATAAPQPITREPVKDRDYDAENRGKVRNNIVEALIINSGSAALKAIATDASTRHAINIVCEYVMNGEEL